MAQVVLGVAGAAAGFAVGGPQGALIGFSVGMALGAPAMKVPGAKLGEIAKITAREGDPRVIVWGRVRPIGGNLVAVQDPRIVKKKKKSGGKGGGGTTTTTTTIFRTYAVGVCEGPITGFIRIWRNNKQVYDGRSGNAWGAENNPTFLAKAKLYLGKYDQLPDASLEAVFGVGNVPAMRGTAYIRLADEDLTDMGGAVPQWLFEVERYQFAPPPLPIPNRTWRDVATNGTNYVAVSTDDNPPRVILSDDGRHWIGQDAVTGVWRAIDWTGSAYVAVMWSTGSPPLQYAMTSPDGQTWTLRTTPDSSWNMLTHRAGRVIALDAFGTKAMVSDDDGATWTMVTTGLGGATWTAIASSPSVTVAISPSGPTNGVMRTTDGYSWVAGNSANVNMWQGICYGDKFVAVASTNDAGDNKQVMTSTNGAVWSAKPTPTAVKNWKDVAWNGVAYAAVANQGDAAGNRVMTSEDGGETWTLRTTPATDYAWAAITNKGSQFVAVGPGLMTGNGAVMVSDDNGVTWELIVGA